MPMKNLTGSASVKGTVISASTSGEGFVLQGFEFDAIGVVYDDGVPNGELCMIVIAGVAEVLLKNGTASTFGNWTKASDTDGRAEATVPPDGLGAQSTSEHFKEIGHCIETKSAGTNVLAKVVLHFN